MRRGSVHGPLQGISLLRARFRTPRFPLAGLTAEFHRSRRSRGINPRGGAPHTWVSARGIPVSSNPYHHPAIQPSPPESMTIVALRDPYQATAVYRVSTRLINCVGSTELVYTRFVVLESGAPPQNAVCVSRVPPGPREHMTGFSSFS